MPSQFPTSTGTLTLLCKVSYAELWEVEAMKHRLSGSGRRQNTKVALALLGFTTPPWPIHFHFINWTILAMALQ